MNKPLLLAGFAVKVLMGLLYGYIFLHYYNGDDTWKLFRASLSETALLINDPKQFFINEFTPENALRTGTSIPEVIDVYLNDLQYVLVVKSMAVMNLVTRGNYYFNSVLFNAIVFFGHYWLFRLMSGLFPSKSKYFFLVIFFFLPAVFWLSGIRVDGILFFFLSLLLYNACGKKEKSGGRTLLILAGFAGVLICRPSVALLCAMALTAWYISERKGKTMLVNFVQYAMVLTIFFATILLPSGGLPAAVASKQHEYFTLKGTAFHLEKLDPTIISFGRILPQAAVNTFLRPLPWETKGFLQMMAAAEIVAFWVIVVTCMVKRHVFWKLRLAHPLIFMMLILGISMYLIIGYMIPFPGAIIRYKAIPELFILCAMIGVSGLSEVSNYKKL